MFFILVLLFAGICLAAPTSSSSSNTTSTIVSSNGTTQCGTPDHFYVRGLWTWIPSGNITYAHPPHFYMDFHDVASGIHTSCFDDPPFGRQFSSEFVPCVNPKVQFRWNQATSLNNTATSLEIKQDFAPCNPWFKSAIISGALGNLAVLTWPDSRWGPGTYLRTPSGEIKAQFDQASISITEDEPKEVNNGVW